MRILMISKALVNGAYQKKCEELAALPDVELIVAVPPAWREPRVGVIRLERRFTAGYQLVTLPIMFNGRHHLHFYPTFERLVRRTRPDIVHVDEESSIWRRFWRCGREYGTGRAAASTTMPTSTDSLRRPSTCSSATPFATQRMPLRAAPKLPQSSGATATPDRSPSCRSSASIPTCTRLRGATAVTPRWSSATSGVSCRKKG